MQASIPPKDAGNIAYQVLVQANRSNHYTVLETWSSMTALDTCMPWPTTRAAFARSFCRLPGSPYDERIYRMLQ